MDFTRCCALRKIPAHEAGPDGILLSLTTSESAARKNLKKEEGRNVAQTKAAYLLSGRRYTKASQIHKRIARVETTKLRVRKGIIVKSHLQV